MIALLTSLLFFIFLAIVGIATAEAIRCRIGVVRGWLLSPVTGLAVVMVCVMVISQAGVPVRGFALPLTSVLLAASCLMIWWKRPMTPLKRLWPLCGVLVFALFYIGWPAISYGFNWAGYGNADAAAYCMSASRIMDHGFLDVPKLADILGRDYTQLSWFQFGPGLYRCGFDLLLAWAASLTRMNPFAIYMPLMLCLGLVQIWGIAALVLFRPRLWRHALLAAFLLAASPMFGFTVFAQVGPQVGGLSLMLGLCTLTLRNGTGGWRSAARRAIMIGLIGLGVIVFYPEVLPFWGLAYLGYQIALLLARRADLGFQMRVALVAGAVLTGLGRANLLRGYFSAVFAITYSEATRTGKAVTYSGFETFKMPHGPAALFGLSATHRLMIWPLLSILIVLGFALLIVCLYRAVRDAGRLQPYAFVSLALAAATALVFRSPNAFGLFKMALFLQPFIMASAAAAATRLSRRDIGALMTAYLLISYGPHFGSVTEETGALPGLSAVGVNLPRVSDRTILKIDAPTSVPVVLLHVYLKGLPQEGMNGRDEILSGVGWVRSAAEPMLGRANPYRLEVAEAESLADEAGDTFHRKECLGFTFVADPQPFSGKAQLATLGPDASYFNGLNHYGDGRFFSYLDESSLRNFLIFVNSDQGQDFYLVGRKPSYFPFEKDYYLHGKRFYGIGRYFLFEVLNPTEAVRIRVSLSRTLMGYGRTGLPRHATIRAEHNALLELIGGGAANVYSSPIHPVTVEGHHYVAIDFGDELTAPPNPKRGLMRMYNVEIPIDIRMLIGYGRDISAVSEEDYSRLERPQNISKWPEDLFRGAGVEFSGFYEDGWVSDHAMMKLGPARAGGSLVIRGTLPRTGALAKGNDLRISINGSLIATDFLQPGGFELSVPIHSDLNVTTVNLDFARQENLPRGDDRPVSAQIKTIGLK